MRTKSKQPIYLILAACVVVLLVMTCKSEKEDADLPVVTTGEIYGITSHWTNASGYVSDDGGSEVTVRGFCWCADNTNPTISDNKNTVGKGMGEFNDSFKGLVGNTTYYVRAYATNDAGTAYGEVRTFTTPVSVTDVDGYEYATVVIGDQTWLAENLRVKHFRNGDAIDYIPSGQSLVTSTPAYWDYDVLGETGLTYGLFYNWYAIIDDRGLPPEGWHVPSIEEYQTLVNFLGGSSEAGYQLRETGILYWNDCDPLVEATNSSGFTALGVEPGGNDRKWEAFFVTITETNEGKINWFGIDCTNEIWWGSNATKPGAFSVRCVKDE